MRNQLVKGSFEKPIRNVLILERIMKEQIEIAIADPIIGPILSVFLQAFKGKVATLKQSFAMGDGKTVQQVLHNLKGTTAMYGFDDLANQCAAIETMDSSQDASRFNEFLQTLEEFARLMEQCLK